MRHLDWTLLVTLAFGCASVEATKGAANLAATDAHPSAAADSSNAKAATRPEQVPDPVSISNADGRDLIESSPAEAYARRYGRCDFRETKTPSPLDGLKPTKAGAQHAGSGTTLDADLVQRVIAQRMADATDCYESALAVWPELHGHIAIKFAIDSRDGKVLDARVADSDLDNEAVGCCIAHAFYDWEFPGVGATGITVVTYPLVLQQSSE